MEKYIVLLIIHKLHIYFTTCHNESKFSRKKLIKVHFDGMFLRFSLIEKKLFVTIVVHVR